MNYITSCIIIPYMALKIDMKQEGMKKLYTQLKRTLDTVNEGYRVKVGVLQPEPYPERSEVSVTDVATWQNYGTKGARPIDSRPFMSYSALFIERSRNIRQAIAKNKELRFSIDEYTAHVLGEYAVKIVRNTIKRRELYKPLAESTVEKKGHDRPLIDTRLLIDSIDYSVHKARQSRRGARAKASPRGR